MRPLTRSRRPVRLIALLALLCLPLFALAGCGRGDAEKKADRIREIALVTLEGKTYRFGPDDEKVTLVVFWATWCQPCLVEIPDLMMLHELYGNRDFRVVSINLDDPDGQLMAKVHDRFNINYPLLMDDGTSEEKFGGLEALPTSFLVGRDGTIKRTFRGVYPVEVLEQAILKEL